MSFLMGPTAVAINPFPKPHFAEEHDKEPKKSILPPPFTEPFNSPFAPPASSPASLPWFQSEKPTFRQKRDSAQARPIQSSHKPWMTCEIMCEIRKKHSLLQTAKNEDTIVAWNEFKQQRTLVSQLLHEAKLKHEINIESYKDKKDKSYFCDTCDRGYASQMELQHHAAEHIYCSVKGCSFEAHPKVVALHRKMQHDTGLAGKIMSLDTPEDIRKWREERKRNFPTAANVERRKREVAEKKSRGELLESKYTGKMKGKHSSNYNNQNRESFDRGSSTNFNNQFREPFEHRGRGRGQRGRGRRRRSRSFRGRGRGRFLDESQEGRGKDGLVSESREGSFKGNTKRQESFPSHETDSYEDTNGNLKRFKGTLTNYENEELISQAEKVLEVHEDAKDDGTRICKRLRRCFEEKADQVGNDSTSTAVNLENHVDTFEFQNEGILNERVTVAEIRRNDGSRKSEENPNRNYFSERANQMCKDKGRPKHQYFDVEVASEEKSTASGKQNYDKNNFSKRTNQMHNDESGPEHQYCGVKVTSEEIGTVTLIKSPLLKSVPQSTPTSVVESGGQEPDSVPSESTNVLLGPKHIVDKEELEEGEIVDADDETCAVSEEPERNNFAKNTPATVQKESHPVDVHKLPSFFTVNENDVSDEEVETPVKDQVSEKPLVQVGGALGSLISNYGTDSDSEGEIKDGPSTSQQVQRAAKPNDVIRRIKRAPDMFPISRCRLTLLEKLLRNEIRHERNVILQCVHHIVKNDFFNVQSSADQ